MKTLLLVLLFGLTGCDSDRAYRCELDDHDGTVSGVVRSNGMTRYVPVSFEQSGEAWEVVADSDGRFEAEVDEGPVWVRVGDEQGFVTWSYVSESPQDYSTCDEVRVESCSGSEVVFQATGCAQTD